MGSSQHQKALSYAKITKASDKTFLHRKNFCLSDLNGLSMISEYVYTNNCFTELGISRLHDVVVQMFLDKATHVSMYHIHKVTYIHFLLSFFSAVTLELESQLRFNITLMHSV